jgi:uncharacterized repeat protein (TIGR01451 family)
MVWEWVATGGGLLAGADVRYLTATSSASWDDYKLSTPDEVLPGDEFVYSVHLEQLNSIGTRPIYLTDPLPPEVDYVSHTGPATYDAGTRTMKWSGVLAAYDTAEFDVTVQAKDPLAYMSVIENEAMISDKFEGEPVEYLNAYTTIGSQADLSIDKGVDVLTGKKGDILDYTIVIQNHGSEKARNAVMTDPVPDYLDVMTATLTASAGIVNYTDDAVVWMGDVPASGEVTVSFQAEINDMSWAGLAIINAAWIVADNHPTQMYSSALTEVLAEPEPEPEPDISVDPAALQATLVRDGMVDLALTIGNEGDADLTWSLAENPVVTWLAEAPAGGILVPTGSEAVTVTFDATGLDAGVYTTTLEVTSDDADEPQINVPVTLTVRAPGLVVEPLALTAMLDVDETTTMSLTVSNTGDADLAWDLAEVTAVDWLSQEPISGTAAPETQEVVGITFDSTGLQAGEMYTATLRVNANVANGSAVDAGFVSYIDVPVTLHVNEYLIYMPVVSRAAP